MGRPCGSCCSTQGKERSQESGRPSSMCVCVGGGGSEETSGDRNQWGARPRRATLGFWARGTHTCHSATPCLWLPFKPGVSLEDGENLHSFPLPREQTRCPLMVPREPSPALCGLGLLGEEGLSAVAQRPRPEFSASSLDPRQVSSYPPLAPGLSLSPSFLLLERKTAFLSRGCLGQQRAFSAGRFPTTRTRVAPMARYWAKHFTDISSLRPHGSLWRKVLRLLGPHFTDEETGSERLSYSPSNLSAAPPGSLPLTSADPGGQLVCLGRQARSPGCQASRGPWL